MPGSNTSGAPNTRDYVLGRGIVRLAQLTAAGLPDSEGFRDLGNATEFNITVAVEDIRHQSSRSGLKITDKRCTISQEVGVSFILDEINFENLAMFLSGSQELYDNAHDATFVDAVISTAVNLGNWYQLKNADAVQQRVYNLDAAGVVYTVEKDDVADVLLVEGVDYEIDEVMGLIRFLPTSILIADGDGALLNLSAAATTPQDLDQVNALAEHDVTGALLFIQENACDEGQKTEYLFHKVSVASEGDFALIGDEFATLAFTGVAEVNSGVSDTSKVLTVRTYDQQA